MVGAGQAIDTLIPMHAHFRVIQTTFTHDYRSLPDFLQQLDTVVYAQAMTQASLRRPRKLRKIMPRACGWGSTVPSSRACVGERPPGRRPSRARGRPSPPTGPGTL
jgi:hypothetical protein